tara:strand:- start:14723 stop:15076 length:354 start_codon:yes stop_codon:yes gene_type:complete
MPSINVNEYGQTLHIPLRENATAATSYSVIIQPRIGESDNANTTEHYGAVLRTGLDVTLGAVQVEIEGRIYKANEYVTYVTEAKDFSHAGQWRYKAEATMSGTRKVIGDFQRLTVLD